MERLMLWLRGMLHSFVLMALLQKKLTEWGDEAFCVSIQRFPQAVCHVCKKHSRFPLPGSTAGSNERCGWRILCCEDPVQPWSNQTNLRGFQWSCGSVNPGLKQLFFFLLFFFINTQASRMIWKLSHFFFTGKIKAFIWNAWDWDDGVSPLCAVSMAVLTRVCSQLYTSHAGAWYVK